MIRKQYLLYALAIAIFLTASSIVVSLVTGCSTVQTIPAPLPSVAPSAVPSPTMTILPVVDNRPAIFKVVAGSKCVKYDWKDRGVAPRAYMNGMALAYSKAFCAFDPNSVVVKPFDAISETERDHYDTLSWYNSDFAKLGMSNPGRDVQTLRHVYLIMIGLGMRESSGQHCCGADMNEDFYLDAEGAEAGLFQASWGARRADPSLPALFKTYKAGSVEGGPECLADVFSDGVKCSADNWKDWGTGDARTWQALTKGCPIFAVEYTAPLIRKLGGNQGEFGPLGHNKRLRKEAELNADCDQMLQEVEKVTVCKK